MEPIRMVTDYSSIGVIVIEPFIAFIKIIGITIVTIN